VSKNVKAGFAKHPHSDQNNQVNLIIKLII